MQKAKKQAQKTKNISKKTDTLKAELLYQKKNQYSLNLLYCNLNYSGPFYLFINKRVMLKRIDATEAIELGLPIKPALFTLLNEGLTIITSLLLIL